MRRTIIIACALLLAAAGARADDDELLRVNKIRVVIGDLDGDARNCGITKEAIERRILLPIKTRTKIKIVEEEERVPHLSIEVGALRPGGICVASFKTQLIMFQYFDFAPGDRRFGTIELFAQSSIGSSDKVDGSSLLNMVEEHGRALATNWLKQNR